MKNKYLTQQDVGERFHLVPLQDTPIILLHGKAVQAACVGGDTIEELINKLPFDVNRATVVLCVDTRNTVEPLGYYKYVLRYYEL
jgi:hypothetical protein